MDSEILNNVDKRNEKFRPNPRLDDFINELREVLEPIQEKYNEKYIGPEYPVVGVIGLSRSGTTLLSQLLASTSVFCYPSNLMSRFSYSSKLGAMIQEMIFNKDLDFRGEFADVQSKLKMESEQGKTSGALGINEFFHFWRRFFPTHEPQFLSQDELASVDIRKMRAEVAGIQDVFNKPFLSKIKMMQANAGFFADKMPELLFVNIYREPRYVMQSLLTSRRAYYGVGNEKIWWGSKPSAYHFLKDRDEYDQVAGQVYYVMKEIEGELYKVDEKNKYTVKYEDLCRAPNFFIEEIVSKLPDFDSCFPSGMSSEVISEKLSGLDFSFVRNTNKDKLRSDEIDKLMSSYNNFLEEGI